MLRFIQIGLLLFFIASCGGSGEKELGPTPNQVRTLIDRLDIRLKNAETVYSDFVDILKQGGAVKADYEYAVETLEKEYERAEKVVVYEGTEYKENESAYLKHQAVSLLFSYLNMTETDLLNLYNGDDQSPNETFRNNRMVLNTFQSMYEDEKEKLLEAFPEE